jgi:hypothetical protein
MTRFLLSGFILAMMLLIGGCAEGAFWRMGRFSPKVREKWAEEEKIADTLFVKKRRMEEGVSRAQNGTLDEKQRVARELGEIVYRDTVLLTRIHAVRLLGQLDCPASNEILENALKDFNSDIRIASIDAIQYKSGDVAVPLLKRVISGDTNTDVRLAATRALGKYKGNQAIEALALAINDNDPALQLRGAESLRAVTGQPYGKNIAAWQDYVKNLKISTGGTSEDLPPAQTARGNPLDDILSR